MEHNSIKIEDILTTEYTDFLEFCSVSGKVFVSELTSVDYIAFRSSYGQSKDRINTIKRLLQQGVPVAHKEDMLEGAKLVCEAASVDVFESDVVEMIAQAAESDDSAFADDASESAQDGNECDDDEPVVKTYEDTEGQSFFQMFRTEPEKYENIKIDVLELSVRSMNCLKRTTCTTVADLLRLRISDLKQIRNMGAKSVDEVIAVLREFAQNYTPAPDEPKQCVTELSKELKCCIEAFLLDESYDVMSLSEEEQAVFSKVVIAADVLGKELCFSSYCDTEYARTISEMFSEFAAPYISFKKCVDDAKKHIASLTTSTKNKKLIPFIQAYTASTNEQLSDLATLCEEETTVATIPQLFEELRGDQEINEISREVNYFLRWLCFDIDTIINDISRRIANLLIGKNSRTLDVFAMRNAGKTLEEIGQELGVTRERVRQIEMKTHKTFWKVYSRQNYDLIMLVYSLRNGDGVIYFNELEEILGDFAPMLWSCAPKMPENDFYYYEKELKAIVVKAGSSVKSDDELLKSINAAVSALPGIIQDSVYDTTIAEFAMRFTVPEETIRRYTEKRYKLDGHFYHDHRLTVPFMCSHVLKERFQAGFKIADEFEGNRFRGFLVDFFGERAKSITNRALDAKVGEIGCLCDRGKYVHPDFLNVEQSLIDAINNYIEQSARNALSFGEVYEALKHLFVGTQISNRYALQGALKKYGCKYQMTRDLIRKKDSVSIASELENFVMERGRVHVSDILGEFLSLTELGLAQIVARCPGVLYEENGYYFHDTTLNILSEDYKNIRPFITEICETVPIHAKVLFDECGVRFIEFMLRNEVDTANKLFSILAYMFGDELSFSRPYVARESANVASVRKILLQLLDDYDTLSVDEVLDICNDNNITYNSVTSHIQWLAPEWLKTDAETIVKRDYTGVTDEVVEQVTSTISEMMEASGYVIASSIEDFIWFPEIDIDWSAHLVECIMKATKKECCIPYPFNRHGKPSTIYVGNKYKDCNYESFVVSVLTDKLRRGIFSTKEDMRDWLVEKDLIDAGLPKFLREEKYFYCDERGVLRVREEED